MAIGLFSEVYSNQRPINQSDTLHADTTFLNHIFDIFTQDTIDNIPESQRSKRKQVDALLNLYMEQPGKLQFSGVATAILQTELEKNTPYFGVGSFDILAFASFGKHTLLFFDLEAIGGNGPDAIVPNISVLNADGGSTTSSDGMDRLTVLEAWAEFKALKDIFSVTLGKIDLTNYFDNNLHANDETSQFLSGVFVNNPILPIYLNTPGIRFRTTFLGKFYVQYGSGMTDPSEIDLTEKHFKILETGFKLFPETGWEANLRVFGYQHPNSNDSKGAGVSFDQLFANTFSIFGRYGKNEPELASWHGIEKAWSIGLGFKQLLFHNEYKIGLAFAETYRYNVAEPERIAEFYFSNQLNKWVFVSPHLQWLQKNMERPEDIYFLGLRLNFSY
jgi:hypothetical protein